MTNVLVLYYSMYGHVETMAKAVAAGALSVEGVEVTVKRALVYVAAAAGIARETRWADLTRDAARRLAVQISATRLPVTGKSVNKDEFVTCGGVRLAEVDFRTMASRFCPGLHLAGELLDVDGVTGGFNFQAAWTTGWIAGRAMAGVSGATQAR